MSQQEYDEALASQILLSGKGKITTRRAKEIADRFVYSKPEPVVWIEPAYVTVEQLGRNLARYEMIYNETNRDNIMSRY